MLGKGENAGEKGVVERAREQGEGGLARTKIGQTVI